MEGLIIALLWLLGGGLALMMFAQGMSRRVDLFSVRNVYLCGCIIYLIVSPIMALKSGLYESFHVVDPQRAAKWYLMFLYIYIGLFLFSYHRLRLTRWLATKLNPGTAEASDSMLTGLAISLIVASSVTRVIGMQVPFLSAVSINVSIAMAAAACAITGWIWGYRKLNPAVLALAAVVILVSMLLVMSGAFSRRPLISILAGFAWGAYYRWARNLSPSRLLMSTVPLVVVAALVVSAFTAVRHQLGEAAASRVTFSQMRGAKLSVGTQDLLTGQATGAIALWAFDKYPAEIEYNHLFSLKYMAYYFIPRGLWEDKPDTLANQVATLARLRGVRRDAITMPPGVIGYAAAEGGFYALVIYALFYGQLTRFFDELVRLHPNNPFVILPVGCAMGQFLGLPRGDMSLFANLAIIGFISTYLLIYLTSLAFGRTGGRAAVSTPLPQV